MATNDLGEHLALMRRWPASWAGDDEDLPAGEALVAELEPFIRHLHAKDLSARTCRRHLDWMWALGGDLIKQSHWEDPPGTIPPLATVVDEEGGPLLGMGEEAVQAEFDRSCRALHRFLRDR